MFMIHKTPPVNSYPTYSEQSIYDNGSVVTFESSTWLFVTAVGAQSDTPTPTSLMSPTTTSFWVRIIWIDAVSGMYVSGPTQTLVTLQTNEFFYNADTLSGLQKWGGTRVTLGSSSWSSGTAYIPGDVVLSVGRPYYCVVANQGQSPSLSVTTADNWVPFWLPWYTAGFGELYMRDSVPVVMTDVSSTVTYSINSSKIINGVPVYAYVDNIYGNTASTQNITAWVRQYNPLMTYYRGDVVFMGAGIDNNLYCLPYTTAVYQVPLTDATRWVPFFKTGVDVPPATIVAWASVGGLMEMNLWYNGSTTATSWPDAYNTTGGVSGWWRVRVPGCPWNDSITYVRNEVVYDLATRLKFRVYTNVGLTNAATVTRNPTFEMKTDLYGWLPEYSASATWPAHSACFDGKLYYYRRNLDGDPAPSIRNMTGNGWLRVWWLSNNETVANAVALADEWVYYNPSYYKATPTTAGTYSGVNPRQSWQWTPSQWSALEQYGSAAIVMHNGYRHRNHNSKIMYGTEPVIHNKTHLNWRIHVNPNAMPTDIFEVGDHVGFVTVNNFVAATGTNLNLAPTYTNYTNTGWMYRWEQRTYLQRQFVIHNREVFGAPVSIAGGSSAPRSPSTNMTTWAPLYSTTSNYLDGQIVYYANTPYIAKGNIARNTLPVIQNTTLKGWVPLSINGTSQVAGDYVYTLSGFRYLYIGQTTGAASSITDFTLISTWARVWSRLMTYTSKICSWYPPHGLAYSWEGSISSTSSDTPRKNNVTGFGLVPVWNGQTVYPGQYYRNNTTKNTYLALKTSSLIPVSSVNQTGTTITGDYVLRWTNGSSVGNTVVHDVYNNGVDTRAFYVYIKSGTIQPSATPPTWSAATNYVRGMIVRSNDVDYCCNVGQVAGVNTPVAAGTNIDAWIQVWRSDITFAPGALCMHGAVGVYKLMGDVSSTGDKPNPYNTGATGWLRIWSSESFYEMNENVVHNDVVYTATIDILPTATLPDLSSDWITQWNPAITYSAGTITAFSGSQFTSLQSQPPGSTPQLGSNDVAGWNPVYVSSTAFNAQLVIYDGVIYYSSTALLAEVPVSPNKTGSGWIPVWRNGNSYAKFDYVWHQGRVYEAMADQDNLSTTEPVTNVTTVTGWVPLWTTGVAVNSGGIVVDEERLFIATRSLTPLLNVTRASLDLSATNWIPEWQPGTYPEGQNVLYNGRVYVAILDVYNSTGEPMLGNKVKEGWIPKYNPADKHLYAVGDYIAYNNRRFRLFGPKVTETAPMPNVTALTETVPEWNANDTYYKDNFVLFEDVLYYAASAIV